MKCPVCDVDLLLAERQWVEMGYCPKCRGVWLNRGELNILIDRCKGFSRGAAPEQGVRGRSPESYPARDYEGEGENHRGVGHPGSHYGRRSFLEELFDLGDPGRVAANSR